MAEFIVEHDSPLSVWGQIQRDLRRRIDGGEFGTGCRIPTELTLSGDYGVSRVTIRRSIRALVEEGYLRSLRGSGTYVTENPGALVCELDLARPWKEQLLIDGHDARSSALETADDIPLPSTVAAAFGHKTPFMRLHSFVTVHTVNGLPIGVTEAWRTDLWASSADAVDHHENREPLVAECFAEVGFATSFQARQLQTHLDSPLIIVVARTHFALSGEIAEFARTSWLGGRVKLAYTRQLVGSQMDVAPR